MIRRMDFSQTGFDAHFAELVATGSNIQTEITQRVADIIEAVKQRGDEALVEYTAKFDHYQVQKPGQLKVPKKRLEQALEKLEPQARESLEIAASRITRYAEQQKLEPWEFSDEQGVKLGQAVRPVDAAGIYVPGGKAAYPSSVLMNAIPAKVAGVENIVMVSPAPAGELNDWVLAAAELAGVDSFYTIGGAQAVAALAWGTETVPAVDKIVGPGNAYVATAKQQVFGQVGIESVAGPSEILIIADGSGDPKWAAIDLFAQAEHDEQAQAILISPDKVWLNQVEAQIKKLLPEQPRKHVIEVSLANRGALIHVPDLAQAVALSNRVAPEHLELAVENPRILLDQVKHAGAVFLGHYTPESFGDYCAGTNHVLPTGRTARFSSALGVYDFQRRISIIETSQRGAAYLAPIAENIACGEGLFAHAQSAYIRGNQGRKAR